MVIDSLKHWYQGKINSLNHYFKQWPDLNIGRIVSASKFSTEEESEEDRYLDSGYEDRYSESFVHGIQPIVEAKKKVKKGLYN